MTTGRRVPRGWVVVIGLTLAWLAIVRPWTVLPIEREQARPFDAVAYVASIWESRVRPAILTNAVALEFFRDVAASPGTAARPGAVVADGVILSVNTSSRVGVALIDLDPVDGRVDATIQIGPVLRGTALRDALDFIQFTDFTNQIEFAAVAGALNDRVLADVLGGIDFGTLDGRRVRVVGAASIDPNAPDARPSVVPVEFTVEDQP